MSLPVRSLGIFSVPSQSFLWIKWRKMRKFVNRNLRLELLFVFCLTWHIFVRYGGVKMNAVLLSSAPSDQQFCPEDDTFWAGGRVGDHLSFWYFLFLPLSLTMIFFMARDFVKDLTRRNRYRRQFT